MNFIINTSNIKGHTQRLSLLMYKLAHKSCMGLNYILLFRLNCGNLFFIELDLQWVKKVFPKWQMTTLVDATFPKRLVLGNLPLSPKKMHDHSPKVILINEYQFANCHAFLQFLLQFIPLTCSCRGCGIVLFFS